MQRLKLLPLRRLLLELRGLLLRLLRLRCRMLLELASCSFQCLDWTNSSIKIF
jgi:hypothetical protein